jgi:NADH-quinone oxidoreductase subunit N
VHLIGALGGVSQKKLKTLLSYSSTYNMGYALLVLGGLTDSTIWTVLFHVIVYQFSGLCIWSLLIISRLKLKIKKEKYNKEIGDLSLLKKVNFPLVFSFAVTLFSLAGIPPLLGFAPKIYILSDMVISNYYASGVFLVLCTIVATFYYIRVIKVILFEDLPAGKLYYPIWAFYSVAISSMIHFFIYYFTDVKCFSAAIVGGSITYLLSEPWLIILDLPPGWIHFIYEKALLDYEFSSLEILNYAGYNKN